MRNVIIAPVFALALAGCAGGITPQSISDAITGVNTTVSEVQAVTRGICSFVPTFSTVSGIISQYIPGLSTAQSIAQSICNAVAPAGVPAARRGRTVPVVAGVPVTGRFVAH